MEAAHEPAYSTREDKDRHNVASTGRTACDAAESKVIEVQQKHPKECIDGFQLSGTRIVSPDDADGL